MRYFLHHSFYTKIQASFLLLILLPTVFISFISYSITKGIVMDKIRLSNQSVLAVMAKDIAKMLDDITYASNFFVQDEQALGPLRTFVSMKGIDSSRNHEAYRQIKDFFSQVSVKTMNTDIFMFIANESGFIVESSEVWTLSPEQVEKSWVEVKGRVDKGNPKVLQWLGTVKNDSNRKPDHYFVARVLKDPSDNRYLSTLVIVISSEYFEKLFGQIPSGNITLTDANGEIIAAGPQERSMEAASASGEIRNEAAIPKAGWSLRYENSKKEVTGQITRTFYLSILIVIPFFVVFLFISFYVAKRLHRPIRKLQTGVKQFGNGNRHIRFQAEGNDEIAELGRTLNHMLDQIHALIADIEQEQEQKRVLELQALYSQIRPHFLLNTLNSIKCSLVLHDDTAHSQKIDSLMSLLRAYLKFNEASSLHSECKLLGHYVEIMRMRNDIQLEFITELSADVEEFFLPKLLLQPLVENAIVHGFTEEGSGHRILLQAAQEEDRIRIDIRDNGSGMEKERLDELNELLHRADADSPDGYKRVGLINVLKRLRMTYGMKAAMSLMPGETGGLTVRLSIPLLRRDVHAVPSDAGR